MKKPFERVVAEHGGTVLRVCRVVVGRDDADDAWSETFLAAMRAYPGLAADANLQAWLVTIAHRKSIDILRARQRRAIPVADLPDQPSRRGIPGEDGHDLWAAVAALSDRQRQSVAYHYVVGLPFAEIAELIGGTESAARKSASDGIRALRISFSADQPDRAR